MAASTSMTQLSSKSQAGLVDFLKKQKIGWKSYYSIRNAMEVIDREYYRESNKLKDNQRADLANRMGDADKFRDITVPVVMPQVETFVTYLTSVFLTGEPIFGVVASPEYEDAALMVEAVIADQATFGGWRAELIKFFRDNGKYSLGACEVSWDAVTTAVLESDAKFSLKEGKPKNVVWEGNRIKRLDLYNTFWDTRVAPGDVAKFGEFAGYDQMVSRTHLKQLIAALPEVITANLVHAFESGTPLDQYYIPQINPNSLVALGYNPAGEENWFSWAGIADGRADIAYRGQYVWTTLYARILPSEFGIKVPSPNTAQVWKLYVVNYTTLVYAERQTNAHDMIPIIFSCPNDDGLKYQTKSLASNVQPLQQVASAMMNSLVASRRRAISDRGIYNPLYINKADINSNNPSAKIPCKPTAYAGVALNEMYYSIPFNDDQASTLMQGISTMLNFADTVSGQNKAQQGQFVKGNKTLHEYDDIMGNADGRSRLAAIVMEDQFFSVAKQILKINILQFQSTSDLYHEVQDKTVTIDPLVLRNASFKFKISDGLVPSDKLINEGAWQSALQVIGSSPQIGSAYNLGPMFSYLMKTQGADIRAFEKPAQQIQYEQAIQSWQQTVMSILKQNPEATAKQFPPQPMPVQFGLGTDGKPTGQPAPGDESQESIVQKIMEASNPNAEQQEPASEV